MPRKHRAIRSGLSAKGFEVEENRKHIHFVYVDIEGRTYHGALNVEPCSGRRRCKRQPFGQMAKQVGLKRAEFLEVVDCPMSREEFDARVRAAEDESDAC
jgi:hypothetical protein